MLSETALLQAHWKKLDGGGVPSAGGDDDTAVLESVLGRDLAERFDSFDLAQLAHVIRVCRNSRSMAEAGRRLFAVSRAAKEKPNDTDRVKKFLIRFGLSWEAVTGAPG